MLEALITGFLFCVFITLLTLFIFSRSSKKGILGLPGPKGQPIIGCFNQMDKLNLHHTLDEWGYKYGDMFCYSLFGKTTLVINTSKLARKLCLEEPSATLSSGRVPSFGTIYLMDYADVLFTSLSDEWMHRRKIAHQVMHVYGRGLQKIEGTLNELLKTVQKRLTESLSTTIDPANIVEGFLLEALETLITGQNNNKDIQNLIKRLSEVFNVHLVYPRNNLILTKFPWIRFLPCQLARHSTNFLNTRDKLFRNLDEVAKTHPDAGGIYHHILKVLEKEERMPKKNKFTMKNVRMIIIDIIVAGYLTSRGFLMSVIKILISRRDVQAKIQSEIDKVIGSDRDPSLGDRKHCPFTEATILETLRYISHTPLTPHTTLESFRFQGINVPKGCTVYVNTWHIHHNKREWPDPFVFRPERFLDDDGNLLPANDSIRQRLLTFGIGKRSCIGEVFAKSRIFLFLTTLLQKHTITAPNNENIPLFHPREMKHGSALMPTDYKCKFIQR